MTTPIKIQLDKTYNGNPMINCKLSTTVNSTPSFMTAYTTISDNLQSNITNTISCSVKPAASTSTNSIVECSTSFSNSQNNFTIGLGTYTASTYTSPWMGNNSKYDSCTLTPTII